MKFEQNWFSGFRGEGCLKMLKHRRTDDRQKVITIAYPKHSSGEVKILIMWVIYMKFHENLFYLLRSYSLVNH